MAMPPPDYMRIEFDVRMQRQLEMILQEGARVVVDRRMNPMTRELEFSFAVTPAGQNVGTVVHKAIPDIYTSAPQEFMEKLFDDELKATLMLLAG